jgi:hypothetical protein
VLLVIRRPLQEIVVDQHHPVVLSQLTTFHHLLQERVEFVLEGSSSLDEVLVHEFLVSFLLVNEFLFLDIRQFPEGLLLVVVFILQIVVFSAGEVVSLLNIVVLNTYFLLFFIISSWLLFFCGREAVFGFRRQLFLFLNLLDYICAFAFRFHLDRVASLAS